MTNDRPLVSVIMPAFNVERYLGGAADSVLRQTYRHLELIIVDDGSTDGTGWIAEQVRRRDPQRVRVLTRPNRGPSAARNAAFAAARGEFFALLDSDDQWEPSFLDKQMTLVAADPAIDLITGNGRFLGGSRHGAPVRPWPDPRPPVSVATIIADEQAVFIMTVYRRRVYDTIGGFDESLRTNEDFEYWLRAALAGFRFARNHEPLGWYRRREDSLTSDAVRMLSGAANACRKIRPQLAGRPELELLDRQIAYYETELDRARAREALMKGDLAATAAALAALHARRPSIRTAIASFLARRATRLLVAVYRLKRLSAA